MNQSVVDRTILQCIDVLKGNFGAGRGKEALSQRDDDIAILESMLGQSLTPPCPADDLMVRIAVNELGRLRPVETKTHYTLGMYEGIHRVVRRMISPTGEASAVMDEQVDALIPSADELEEHTRAIYKDLESTFMPTLNSPRKKYPFTDRLLTWLLKIFR